MITSFKKKKKRQKQKTNCKGNGSRGLQSSLLEKGKHVKLGSIMSPPLILKRSFRVEIGWGMV